MTTTGDETLVGRVLDGRYHLRQVLARGGMGTVLLATDTRLDRTVAVKVMLNAVGGDQDFTARLQAEARAAARLNHPNVVAVFDQGDDAGLLYLVMEYVPGHTLRDVITREAPLPPRRVLALVEPLLLALSAAHDARIIHRDVKPENVLITPTGHVKVADFGLARAITARSQATTGVLIGSVSYLAPELVLNEGADARCDVYAVGAVMYEMLTGLQAAHGRDPDPGRVPARARRRAGTVVPGARHPAVPRRARLARDRPRPRPAVRGRARPPPPGAPGALALEADLPDDVELTQDLRLHRIVAARSDDLLETSVTNEAAFATTVAGHDSYDAVAAPYAPTGPPVAPSPPYDPGYEATRAVTRDASGIPTAPDAPAGDRASAGQQRRQRRRGRRMLILALVVALLAGSLGWWFGVARFDQAPDLTGMPLEQARSEAQDAGYTVETDGSAFSETIPAGSVTSTDPAPGAGSCPTGPSR